MSSPLAHVVIVSLRIPLRLWSDFALYTRLPLISGEFQRRTMISGRKENFWHTVVRRRHLRQPRRWHPYNDTPREKKGSAPSFFFYIRERGKKNHRFSLRSTRRQLYESLPWSLDLHHISSQRSPWPPLPPPAPCYIFYPHPTFPLCSLPPLGERRERRRYYLFRKLTPGQGERDWKILRSSIRSFSAFINRHHSPG